MEAIEDEEPIYELAVECERLFVQQISKLNKVDQPNGAKILAELSQRFAAWAAFLGVFAASNVCLDRRLRRHVEVQDQVLRLLDILQRNLTYLLERDDPPDRIDIGPSAAPQSSLQPFRISIYRLDAISGAIERLELLGISIRHPSVTREATKARHFAETFDMASFEGVAYLSVKTLYPDISESLLEQLIQSMTETYSRFLHRKYRQDQLQVPRSRPLFDITEETVEESDLEIPVSTLNLSRQEFRGGEGCAATLLQRPSAHRLPVSGPTSVDSHEVQKRFDKLLSPARKDETVSILVNQMDYPQPAEGSLTCEWCFSPIPTDSREGDKWRRHINEDFEPYVCISENCSQSLMRFATSTQWLEHMLTIHGKTWHREVHVPLMWACPLCDDEESTFSKSRDLTEHLESLHAGTFTESQVQAIVRQCRLRSPRGQDICPLCCLPVRGTQDDLSKEMDSDNGSSPQTTSKHRRPRVFLGPSASNTASLEMIASHVAAHLQGIMLLTLRFISIDISTDHQSTSGSTDDQSLLISSSNRSLHQDPGNAEDFSFHSDDEMDTDNDSPLENIVPDCEHIDWSVVPRRYEALTEPDPEDITIDGDASQTAGDHQSYQQWNLNKFIPHFLTEGFSHKNRLRKQLLGKIINAIEIPKKGIDRFAPRGRLMEIWTEGILRQFFRRETLLLARKTFVQDIRRDFVQTISILVYVNWDGWSRFDRIFFSHRRPDGRLDRTDRSIRHYDLQTLTSKSFLGPVAGSHFFDNRHTFCPVDIIEGDTDPCHEDGWRLPFLPAQSEPRGSGGFGHITKEVIAARHYYRKSGVCTTEVKVARKLFKSKLDYDRERINLKWLSESIAQHKRIVLPLATITIGHQFNILFPLAKMDLEDFLVGGLISPRQCSMDELLDEVTNLADALDHLHNRLGVSTRGYHMDLKPANILVYEDPNPLMSHGVGKWKITDFGLSIIERPEKRDSVEGFHKDPVTETITRLKGMEGTYQAPEVKDGGISRRSDVWSFGCILVRVFAFALDGIEGLHRLDRLRQKAEDGVGSYEHDYFARGNPPVLNPHIENWIRRLPHRRRAYNDEFLDGCANLLLSTLRIDKNERPEAIKLKDALGDLKFALRGRPRQWTSLGSTSEDRSEGLDSAPTSRSTVSDPVAQITSLGVILIGRLVDKIKENDLNGIERVLVEKVQVDMPDEEGNTPLGIAIKLGNEAVVRRLLQANASVDAKSAGNKTPLMIAARNGHTQIAQLLLERNPDVTVYSDEGLTCLHYATWANVSVELFRLLISQFPTVDILTQDPQEETPLMMLIKHFVDNESWEAKFHALVDAGANINRPDKFGTTPIRCAVSEGFVRAARLLIAKHAERDDPSTVPNMTRTMVALFEET